MGDITNNPACGGPVNDAALRAASEIVRMWVGIDHVSTYVYPVARKVQAAIDAAASWERAGEARVTHSCERCEALARQLDGNLDYFLAAEKAVRAEALGAETPAETLARLKRAAHLGRWLLSMPPNVEIAPTDYASFDGSPPRRRWSVKNWQGMRLGHGSTPEDALREAGVPEPTDGG